MNNASAKPSAKPSAKRTVFDALLEASADTVLKPLIRRLAAERDADGRGPYTSLTELRRDIEAALNVAIPENRFAALRKACGLTTVRVLDILIDGQSIYTPAEMMTPLPQPKVEPQTAAMNVSDGDSIGQTADLIREALRASTFTKREQDTGQPSVPDDIPPPTTVDDLMNMERIP